MAKLVDALCSGRSVRKDVLVRIRSWAPVLTKRRKCFLRFIFFMLVIELIYLAESKLAKKISLLGTPGFNLTS